MKKIKRMKKNSTLNDLKDFFKILIIQSLFKREKTKRDILEQNSFQKIYENVKEKNLLFQKKKMNDLPKKKFIKRKNQIEENYKIKEKKMKKRTYRIKKEFINPKNGLFYR